MYSGAGKKTGISEIRYIDMDISKFEKIDTFDDVIYDIGNRYIHIDISIFLAKNGHIDMDISIYRYRYVHFRYIHIDMSIFGYGYIGKSI